MKNKHQAFTLIEIMIAVGIAGIIAVSALTPLVYTVKTLEDAQASWGVSSVTERFANRVFFDARHIIPLKDSESFRIQKTASGDDDNSALFLWSGSSVPSGGQPALVAYAFIDGFTTGREKPGIYRWEIRDIRAFLTKHSSGADRSDPSLVTTDMLKPEDGRLVTDKATALVFSVPGASKKDDWKKNYSGKLPSILKIEIKTDEKSYEYETRFPFTE